jgi:hypothetical protein
MPSHSPPLNPCPPRAAFLTRALYPSTPGAVTAASLIATPFRPFFISSLHTTVGGWGA